MLWRAERSEAHPIVRTAFAVAILWPVVLVGAHVLEANTDPWFPWRVVALCVSLGVAAVPVILRRVAGRRGFLVGAIVWGAGAVLLFPFLGVGLYLVPLAVSYGVLARFDRADGSDRRAGTTKGPSPVR